LEHILLNFFNKTMTKTLSNIIELPELLLKKESGYMTDIIFLIYKI